MKNIRHLLETDSTNRIMMEDVNSNLLFYKELERPYMISADYQRQGRGQDSNCWESARGANLLATVAFRPRVTAARQFVFNQYFALATRTFLLRYIPDVKIKWPNDIYVGDQKLAGILIEHILNGEQLQFSLAGIGININQTSFSDALPNPVSLAQLTSKRYNMAEMREAYYEVLANTFAEFQERPDDTALEQAYEACMYQRGEMCSYVIRGERVRATITGVDIFGRLCLTLSDGRQQICGLKEIVFEL